MRWGRGARAALWIREAADSSPGVYSGNGERADLRRVYRQCGANTESLKQSNEFLIEFRI